jgi:hypothetical protein
LRFRGRANLLPAQAPAGARPRPRACGSEASAAVPSASGWAGARSVGAGHALQFEAVLSQLDTQFDAVLSQLDTQLDAVSSQFDTRRLLARYYTKQHKIYYAFEKLLMVAIAAGGAAICIHAPPPPSCLICSVITL